VIDPQPFDCRTAENTTDPRATAGLGVLLDEELIESLRGERPGEAISSSSVGVGY